MSANQISLSEVVMSSGENRGICQQRWGGLLWILMLNCWHSAGWASQNNSQKILKILYIMLLIHITVSFIDLYKEIIQT